MKNGKPLVNKFVYIEKDTPKSNPALINLKYRMYRHINYKKEALINFII